MILALAQTKGGVGKTTLAVNLAVERATRARRDVLLVDADDQATATDFAALRSETKGGAIGYTSIQLSGAAVRSQVLALKPKYDDIIIDVGGRDTTALRAALTVAQVAVVPFQPRSFDVWTIDKVAALISEARTINPDLRAVAVINCADPQGADNDAAAEALGDSAAISFLGALIGRRKAFPNAAAAGLSVLELAHPDYKASNELRVLADHLFDGAWE
ncbi:AAA family ATPase [Mycobacterium sp. KBS0706]|uniref:AAA family ATPase n=1 Tax=Mycobacterium sp. KBS0706 TaxID=2578109 RepID=UPI00110F90CA|nr:AAA family ATPase [Mycobacterium sp. KBS0706]TSD83645.1 AAA family ATPase [Mycobacterium sp. KBS0706]